MSFDPVVCQTCDKRDNCDSHEAVKEQMLGAQEVMAGFARIGRGASRGRGRICGRRIRRRTRLHGFEGEHHGLPPTFLDCHLAD